MKKFTTILLIGLMAVVFGCSGGGEINGVIQKAAISSASYSICKDNPEAIPAIKMLCVAPTVDLGAAIADLYAKYDGAIEDPFLKMQADILIAAFMDQYGVDITDPGFDFSGLAGEEMQPFVDAVCMGVVAAEGAI